ncbi:MAG: type II secretion system F family protein [Nitrosomonas sp.]|nr:MAG: type II secretion system F family protein [Nitrosomonas sp.]HMW21073.1 type II secretion system F family protein [Nitrosomonas sp.]HMY62249.1 type II secretion system F family protein [Nitrosomonas sp.]HMY90633.1 type II secretion system F family protein [Nitrosomonas sp.]HNA71683.1 type II secretion system F family protein [Nitrosomonas sp.]
MISMQTIFLVMIFLAVAGISCAIMIISSPRATKARLKEISSHDDALLDGYKAADEWKETVVKLSEPLAKLALPSEEWEQSALRTRFMHAGYRGNAALTIYFATKTFLALLFPGLFFFFAGIGQLQLTSVNLTLILLIFTAIGFYLPNLLLARKIKLRQRELFESFPDAIDLMTVCVEAGLGLDAALAKVGEEMELRSPILGEEIHLVGLELRAGASREKALRNLALRTGVEEIEALVAMLVQADRFGTSTADSLRVYSDTLRTKRRLRAEEAAAKIALKLLFPLIFFIFPALMVVLMGPAFISIYRNLLPALAGQ